jgi:uncharacterized protein (DUF952 family)
VKSLFHITTRTAWDRSQGAREYRPASLASEGFIHLSTDEQWRHTLHRLFRGQPDLVILKIDAERAGDVRFEPADGDVFPHLYGPLAVEAVMSIREAPRMVELPVGFAERIAAADDSIADVVACAISDRGRPMTYVVLAAKPGRAGQISLADAMAAGKLPDVGWMQVHSLPRHADGTLDEVALLAYVESLVQDD